MKKCPKCGRTSPPALAVCPRCKTPFNATSAEKSAGHQPVGKMPGGSQTESSTDRSRKIILFVGIAVVIVIAAAFSFYFSDEIKRKGRLLTQKMQGREWKYPPGDEAETARVMSVQQLIEAWETVPDRSQRSLHSTYAKALGLKGKEAVSAIPVLAPYVTDKYLGQGAMEGLAGIGEEGLPHLIKALNYWNKADGNDSTIRWDAAMAIAKMGPKARNADKDLLAAIMNPEENPNVKGDSAAALAGIGNDAVPSLNKARCYFYDQGGLSPAETGVLRTINIALRNLNAPTEPCKGLDGQQATATGPSSSSSMFLSAAELSRMQVPQLLEALRSHPYNTREITDELVKKGAKTEAAEVLTSMLKNRVQKSDLGIKMALGKLGAPITYDNSKNVFLPISEDNIGYIDFSVETKGDSVYSSGKIYIGRDVIAGLKQRQQGMVTVPTFVKYTLTVKGGSLGQPVEKTFEVNTAGENAWDNVLLVSGISSGKYSVTLFLHAQFAKEDGSGMILNNNAGFLEVER